MTNKECVECLDNKSIVYFMNEIQGKTYGVIIRMEPNNALIEDKDGEHSWIRYELVHKARTAYDDYKAMDSREFINMYFDDLKQIVSKKVDK